MSIFVDKRSRRWALSILILSLISGIIGNTVTGHDIAGGTILILLLVGIPFGIEILRKHDPVHYYGLDFGTLRKIDLPLVLRWAFGIFIVIALVDHFLFGLWEIILHEEGLAVGSTTTALARSDWFFLGVVVIFSGTFLEEIWFRGMIQMKLSRLRALEKINPHFAIFLQSTLFGLVHFLPIYFGTGLSLPVKVWFFVYPALIGIVIGYLNERYHSLWPGWIIHYTNNLMSLLLLALLFRI